MDRRIQEMGPPTTEIMARMTMTWAIAGPVAEIMPLLKARLQAALSRPTLPANL